MQLQYGPLEMVQLLFKDDTARVKRGEAGISAEHRGVAFAFAQSCDRPDIVSYFLCNQMRLSGGQQGAGMEGSGGGGAACSDSFVAAAPCIYYFKCFCFRRWSSVSSCRIRR